jgi:pimeloyl-ACP methyl ester carboxylesterase
VHLLLLPGLDGTGRLFEPLIRHLPPGLRPVVVAYPGDKPYGYAELLPLVEAAIPEVGDFLVLGESFSGPLALILAAQQPPRLRGVILCASFAVSPLPVSVRWLRGILRHILVHVVPFKMVRHALLGRFDSPALAQTFEQVIFSVQPAVMAARALAILAVDVRQELRACRVPILYLRATEDSLISPRSLDQIKQAQPHVVEAAVVGPHLILQAAPEAAATIISEFSLRALAG